MKKQNTVEEYILKNHHRQQELEKLREILLSLPFEETIKWGMPTYMIEGKNILSIGAFKNWSCLWFHQGHLIDDEDGLLVNAQEGKTQEMRQWRFESEEDIHEDTVIKYAEAAISNYYNHKNIAVKSPSRKPDLLELPEILTAILNKNKTLEENFEQYTIAQKNEFINYLNEAKRESTKKDRLNKVISLLDKNEKLQSLWS